MQNFPLSFYTADQIRSLEQRLISENVASGFELMTRAAAAVVACLRRKLLLGQRCVVLCGSGNNAGDGLVIATKLMAEGGGVMVFLLHAPENFKGDALTAYQNFLDAGGEIQFFKGQSLPECDFIVDALLGTGLSRPVAGLYLSAIQRINKANVPVFAVDVPSGMHADTGKVMADAVRATHTITFIGAKQGLCTGDARDFVGELQVAELGTPKFYLSQISASVMQVTYQPLPKRSRCAHKGNHGHTLIIGGACGYSGAVMLAATAALRVGSGLVSIATRPEHAPFLNLQRPELMCHAIDDPEQLQTLLTRATVVVVGPGLGQGPWAQALLQIVLECDKPVILDADALNLIALTASIPTAKAPRVLTPHPGEAARLLNVKTADIELDRFAAVAALQQKYAGSMVLKGAGTLIRDSEGTYVVTAGNPGMASGGMGDVLSGVIAGLIAQGMHINAAVRQGVLLHELAGDMAVQENGERGLLAQDLMAYLRKLVNA